MHFSWYVFILFTVWLLFKIPFSWVYSLDLKQTFFPQMLVKTFPASQQVNLKGAY